MDDWTAPLDPSAVSEAQRENDRHGDDKRWARDEVVEKWNEAAQDRDTLSVGYMKQRGLDISLIGPDEMRTGGHRANKKAKAHPALLFPATNDVGEVTRVQAVRFRGKALTDGKVERFASEFHPKITNGGGYDPVRFKALPGSTDDRILICEGPEDALTLRQVTGCEAWASLSISCLKHMPVPEGRTAVVFTDRGSEDETLKACAKLADAGATVFIAQPPEGHKDVNDALRAGETDKITSVMDQAERVQSVYDTLPEGYIRNSGGWVCRIEDPSGNPNDPANQKPICKGLKILGLARNRDGSGWGQVAEVEAPDGNVLRWVIPANTLVGTSMEAMKVLADMGLRIAIKGEEGLRVLLGCWLPPTKYRSVDKLGWTSTDFTSFTIRDGSLIASVKSEPVTLADTVPISTEQMSGTLEGWKEEVGERARGNPLLMLAISTAFAGPLLEPMNEDGGGIHLVGESSRGKTTALRASVSVWGMLDLIETWRATSNGLEGRAAVANSTCLYLDEMSEVSAKEAGETSYMLGNGQGKARANRAGGARPIQRWKVVFLSTGEIALGDKLAEGKIRKRAGQGVRLLDIPATGQKHGLFDNLHGEETASKFADRVNWAARDNAGHAGPTFVRMLMGNLQAATDTARETIDTFTKIVISKHKKIDGQVQRAAKRFGLILAAGKLAIGWGILPWKEEELDAAIIMAFDLWIGKRGGVEAAEEAEAIRMVRSFISKHGGSRFEEMKYLAAGSKGSWIPDPDQSTIRNRAGWMLPTNQHAAKGNSFPTVYMIPKDVWEEEVVAGLDPIKAAKVLKDRGCLITKGGRLDHIVPRSIDPTRSMRVYSVKADILGLDT